MHGSWDLLEGTRPLIVRPQELLQVLTAHSELGPLNVNH